MTEFVFDYSDYGVFNGKPTLTSYNREERRKYIKEQENEDIMEDKLSKKEYINPFKGLLK